MTLFAQNTQITHFRLPRLPSNPNLAPSASLSRSSTAARSLKKMPSSLFNKESARSPPRSKGPGTTVVEEQSSKSSRFFPSPKRTVKDSTKPKTKARKALGEIFGWGNSHAQPVVQPAPSVPSPSTKPVISAPIALAATVPPPKDTTMPSLLKNRPSRQLSGRSSKSALSIRTSLRAPQATPQTRARPSMGEDPFSRREEGAQVVDVVLRHGIASAVRSSTYDAMSEKRSSVGSSKALSGRTSIGAEDSVRGIEARPRPITPSSTLSMPLDTSRLAQTVSQTRHTSVPLDLRLLDSLPPRSASLGPILEGQLPTPSPSAVPSLEFASDKSVPTKTLRRDKTKSKVWGIFGGGKKKDKKDKVEASPESKPRHAFEVRPVDAPFGVRASRTTGTRRSASTGSSQSDVPAANRSVSNGTNRSALPVLQVQRPSLDDCTSTPPQTRRAPCQSVQLIDERFADAPTPSPPADKGPWLSVVGSTSERPSADGPRGNIVAAVTAQHGLPKRKSLSGLFGLALRRSMDRLRQQGSRSSLKSDEGSMRLPPAKFNGNTLRSLAEEMESAETGGIKAVSSPYRSRFGGGLEQEDQGGGSNTDLRGVAAATDQLSALVMLDFSPGVPTPSNNASPLAPPSLASLEGSPTPMRRARSAVLTSKKSANSPLKAGISPLRLALHKSQVASKPQSASLGKATKNIFARERSAPAGSPLKTSMVRKGMRNIFAPPTPPQGPTIIAQPSPAAVPIVDETVGMGRTMGSEVVPSRTVRADMPADLQAILGNHTGNSSVPSSLVKKSMLGLPPVPPPNRVSPRRANGRAPPAISLPPVPDYSPKLGIDRISPVPPQLTLDLIDDDHTSIFSEILDSTGRHSFDFTGEYANLDRGEKRASFVEALAQMSSGPELPPLPSPPGLVHAADLSHISEEGEEELTTIYGQREEMDDDDDEEDEDEDLEQEIATAQVQRTPRPAPFKGQPAFQAHVAQFRISPARSLLEMEETAAEPAQAEKTPSHPFSFVSQPAAVNLPQGRRRQRRQDEAGVSIASMSSIGSVIETGIAGDYTNFFEANFQNQTHARNSSVDKALSSQRSRDRIGRSHHRRSSSVISVESIQEELASAIAGMGPPVSMHNARRSGYISRHRRGSSGTFGSGGGDSVSFGRSDWAAHKRASSTESNSSSTSLVRLGRPGLGDRMFTLDGGVQLTSITGSPANGLGSEAPTPVPARTQTQISARRPMPQPSADSLLGPAEFSRDSIFNSTADMSREDSLFHAAAGHSRMGSIFNSSAEMSQVDSIFDGRTHAVSSSIESDSFFSDVISTRGSRFMLKGLSARPDSMMSSRTDDSGETGDDTVRNDGCSPMPKGQAACHEADGEDNTMTRSLAASASNAQLITSQPIPRPAKPRRRHAGPTHLTSKHSSIASESDVPSLSSPSASEASSRLSLETKMSDVASIFGSIGRPNGGGHSRQKSSVGVQVQATIREEPSNATLRDAALARQKRTEPRVVDWDDDGTPAETVRSWNEWKREADKEYRRMRSYDGDDDQAQEVIADFRLPMTLADVNAFIAKSHQIYRPLEQTAPARRVAHRRKSSLSDARQMLSPYGLPLPKPPAPPGETKPKKVSLQTKYERTQKSSTSSYLTAASDDAGTSVSAISTPSRPPLSSMFAQFARELPPSPPPVLANLPFTPFALPLDNLKAAAPQPSPAKQESQASTERPRVDSGARRAALGWGRRRNSDGPTKVEQMARVYEQVAAASRAQELASMSFSALAAKHRSGSESVVRMPRMMPSPLAQEIKADAPPIPSAPAPATHAPQQSKSKTMLAPKTRRPALAPVVNGAKAALGPSTGLKIKSSNESRSTGSQRAEGKLQANKVLKPKASGRKVVPKRSISVAQPRAVLV